MANFFKDLVSSEPHSLEKIEKTLDLAENDQDDFIALLKDHHDFLEESISVLEDLDAPDVEKQNHLIRFFRLLEMHGKAEEETLYAHLRQNAEREARLEGFVGQDEHDIAFQIEQELMRMGYQNRWDDEIAAKAKVVAGLVKNHIKDEEKDIFAIAQKYLDDEEMDDLLLEYVAKCRVYLDESRSTSMSNPLLRSRVAADSISNRI